MKQSLRISIPKMESDNNANNTVISFHRPFPYYIAGLYKLHLCLL